MTWLEFSLFYARYNTVLLKHTCFSCVVHLLWLFIRNIEKRKTSHASLTGNEKGLVLFWEAQKLQGKDVSSFKL